MQPAIRYRTSTPRSDGDALALEPNVRRIGDGMRPTPAGHMVIAERWRWAAGL